MAADLHDAVRAIAERPGARGERAQQLAEFIRSRTNRRWVGIYEVTPTEVVNLAWSGPGPPAYPSFPVARGLTAAAISARETVVFRREARRRAR